MFSDFLRLTASHEKSTLYYLQPFLEGE